MPGPCSNHHLPIKCPILWQPTLPMRDIIHSWPEYHAGYVPDSDSEEDSEEEHADYPVDGGDEDDEPSDDDDRCWMFYDKADEPFLRTMDDDEEAEERLAPVDSFVWTLLTFTRLHRAQKTVKLEPPMSPSMKARIAEHAAALTPPLPQHHHLLLLPSTSHRTDIPEAEIPPRKSACFATPAPGLKIGESSAAGAARHPGLSLKADT
ncbi:hypothetical protein Tco_0589042 [Tanacetum coccineum]